MAKWITVVTAIVLSLVLSVSAFAAPGQSSKGNAPAEGKIQMQGDIGDFVPDEVDDPAHDPAIIRDGNQYIVFSTGILRDTEDPGGIYIRTADKSMANPWESVGEIPAPEWVKEYNPEHLWAPQVVKAQGTFYLYYAVSAFGTNNSAIGVASSKTPADPDSWEDHGPVITSSSGEVDYNAIDPHVFKDNGQWWITFGSHFSGIKLQQLSSMTEAEGEVHTLANRPGVEHNPIEAPTIYEKNGYYYLFTSWDQCCQFLDSTYKIAVGRADNVEGPYYDQDGVPLAEGGGTILLESEGNQVGPGGQDVFFDKGRDYLIHHYYDGDADGVIRMQIRQLVWENDWPQLTE
ncbi:arabinan endo-1,5-alpha-L-arabinosidase [Alkalicoccus daliensis]|uniref:Endo-alpha-(1->5)-L-arabinanase n=1 Tax=Alkalicoccus daliensis TaxID=745820 RepID=A0A1H0FXX7_9BACI|nr:arabinan endo-1,5-alpha-L-arabinosidase [Alkalicoccus daliensis]SDN99432.1 arabinan endo-1,5-alpha-L-arabinosidase [Alkalicoccus daliensis]